MNRNLSKIYILCGLLLLLSCVIIFIFDSHISTFLRQPPSILPNPFPKLEFIAPTSFFQTIISASPSPTIYPTPPSQKNEIVTFAKKLFVEKKANGQDLSSGPCLSNELVPD